VRNALALDYPRSKLEVVVCCDGCTDATAESARDAGADLVLDLPRGGKVATQDKGVARARGEIVAFSDANATLDPDALRELVARFDDPDVGYVCGQVRFVNEAGTNQEGLYWRYEMLLRGLESRLASVTGGNGAIYATRKEAYLVVDPVMGHDLSFPFNLVKRGWRCVYRPGARATEKMVPSIEGEWRRKRRMMSHAWPIVLRGGLLDPRGYPPGYAVMIASHRVLRYAGPFLHLLALRTRLGLALHVALLAAALAAPHGRLRLLLVARYYVLTQASIAAGLWDWARHGTEAGWTQAEGTR
jgi:glycosyltransferase involved in cell wall biosynthesis